VKDAFDAVTEFHRAYGQEVPDAPRLLDPVTQDLRYALIKEEFDEYVAACEQGDMVGIADALADLAYVVLGAAVAHGIRRFPEIFAEIHRSNMSKLGPDGKPIRRADGKVLKGPNYSPPQIATFLAPDQ
jgi:predicted HAD superfamily Cof-like phosphohydrolase